MDADGQCWHNEERDVPSAGLGRNIVVSLWVTRLKGSPVSHESENHSNATRVVNPVATHCVYKPESLETANFE